MVTGKANLTHRKAFQTFPNTLKPNEHDYNIHTAWHLHTSSLVKECYFVYNMYSKQYCLLEVPFFYSK